MPFEAYCDPMNQTLLAAAPVNSVPLTQAALDYQRIEKAIVYLHSHFLEQPSLAAVARAAHVSEYHFQRLFTRWAGVSPKRFLQFLTVEHAKRLLNESKAVLEVALDSGLSSPGRLHDLLVSVEAVTPGEFKSRGAGIQIVYGFHPSPFGTCLLGLTRRGICWLSFMDGAGERGALRELKSHWSGAGFAEQPGTTARVAQRVFSNLSRRRESSLGLLMMGTNFQLKVWQALLKIPAGVVMSYEMVGALIGAPSASRAIGAAVGQNPVAWLIPCHRVIRKTGLLGGYRWGEPRKRAILAWEAAQQSGDKSTPFIADLKPVKDR
jgi:AraC family transcriptional regulator, regulatory protein of adaptative response / methylated-DNA-[protein]-cysteine methyltransferase